jgi:hypothetical protein
MPRRKNAKNQENPVEQLYPSPKLGPVLDTQHRKQSHTTKSEILDISENTSDEEGHSGEVTSKRSAGATEHGGKRRSSLENATESNEGSASDTPEAKRRRKKATGKRVKTPRYIQSKQRRDLTQKNWEAGLRRNATPQRIETEISEATVPSLAMVPETLRVLGFAIIHNYKKVTSDDVNTLYDSGSEENASAAAPRLKAVFSEGNVPTL